MTQIHRHPFRETLALYLLGMDMRTLLGLIVSAVVGGSAILMFGWALAYVVLGD